jgi:uroporphyrinogen decarboxylase
MELNSKGLFIKILNFEKIPRTLKWEFGYWGGTIRRWYKEGFMKTCGIPDNITYGDVVAGPALQWPETSVDEKLYLERDVANYFNFDKGITYLPVNQWFSPRFEKRILKESEDMMILIDSDGIKKKIFKDNRCMPFWLDFPVKTEKDWDQLVDERLNLDNLESRFLNGFQKAIKMSKNRNYPLSILGDPCGFFGSLRYLLGEERLFMMYYDNPGLIKKMNSYLCDFWIGFAEELLRYTNFDFGYFFEDISGKQGMLVSPDIFNEFMAPYYKKIISFLNSKGINHIIVDSDGYVEKLIPLLKNVGVTGMLPFEKQAGNDLLKIRREHTDFIIMGGFNKSILRDGNINIEVDLKKELDEIKELIKMGGYIPFGDHFIPPDVSWKNYSNYRIKLNKIIENTPVLN